MAQVGERRSRRNDRVAALTVDRRQVRQVPAELHRLLLPCRDQKKTR